MSFLTAWTEFGAGGYKNRRDARERYSQINQILVNRFETALSFLESGQLLTSELRGEQEAARCSKDRQDYESVTGGRCALSFHLNLLIM